MPNLELRVDRIFEPKDHPATPYHYEEHTFHLSGEAAALAQEAGWFYQSQGGNKGQGNLKPWDKLSAAKGIARYSTGKSTKVGTRRNERKAQASQCWPWPGYVSPTRLLLEISAPTVYCSLPMGTI